MSYLRPVLCKTRLIIVSLSDYHHLNGECVEPTSHFISRWNMIVWVCVVLNGKVVHSN